MSLIDSMVGYNLRRAATRQRERFRNAFSPYEIRPVQLTALTVILNNDGLGQSPLGKALDIKRANVVKLLDELQERGLIERRPSIRDRRAYKVHLTPKGRDMTRKILDIHKKLEANLALSLRTRRRAAVQAAMRSIRPAPSSVSCSTSTTASRCSATC